MALAAEIMLGLRYIGVRRGEAFATVVVGFSLIGTVLAVGTLIVVMSVMTGFRHELLRQLGSASGQLLVQGLRGPVERQLEVEARLTALPGVASVAAIAEGRGLAIGPSGARGILLRGIEAESLTRRGPISAAIAGDERDRFYYRGLCGGEAPAEAWGTLAGFDSGNGAVLGRRLAEGLGVGVGDEITLVSPQVRVTPLGLLPRSIKVRVQAMFCAGMYDIDSNVAFLPLVQAQGLLDLSGQISTIEVFLDRPEQFREMRATVRQAVGGNLLVYDWVQIYGGFFAAVEAQTNVLFVVLLLIVLVAAFSIVSGLTMLVRSKTSDIAILRTVGARRSSILRAYLLVGTIIGGVGTLGGTILGIAFAVNIDAIRRFIQALFRIELFDPQMRLLAEVPHRIDPLTVATIAGVSGLFAVLAALLPAWRASQLDPADALRRE